MVEKFSRCRSRNFRSPTEKAFGLYNSLLHMHNIGGFRVPSWGRLTNETGGGRMWGGGIPRPTAEGVWGGGRAFVLRRQVPGSTRICKSF